MLHSQAIKDKVRQLRRNGLSLNQINEETHIPKTTIRTWISDIVLSYQQLEKLKQRTHEALQKGRIRKEKLHKRLRIQEEKMFLKKGVGDIQQLSQRELFITGIALYWAEGFKNSHERRLGFCNSDPNMVRFYLLWLNKCLGIDNKNLVIRLTLNKAYENRAKEIEKYWSELTNVPLSQFTKPFFQNTQWKKQFNTDNYKGVLRIHVKESLGHLLTMKGWIEGLKNNLPT